MDTPDTIAASVARLVETRENHVRATCRERFIQMLDEKIVEQHALIDHSQKVGTFVKSSAAEHAIVVLTAVKASL